ncbi:MAG: carbohydrate-binding family V/XII, partial [Proteobacteria bacterium]|nr:carbohydrate-binding family V/XII [Pseudomonadota bacterium]
MVSAGYPLRTSALRWRIGRQFFFLTAFLVLLSSSLYAQDFSWPAELSTDKGKITLYQPQLDSFEKNILEGRMALSFTEPNKGPLFGALWFRATLDTDLDSRTATLNKLVIPEVKFPDMEDSASIQEIKDHIIREVQRINPVIAIDNIVAELSNTMNSGGEVVQLNNAPPDIYFRDKPTLLVTIDGEPRWMAVDDTKLEAVRNTPFFIVREKNSSSYYLNGGGFWYISDTISKGWKVTGQVPESIRQFAEKNMSREVEIPETVGQAPALLVVTRPSELIVVNGKEEYTPVRETQLLFVKNTESDLLLYIPSQTHYLLLAGRWYASRSLLDNDWKFVEPDELPADFAKIPKESDIANVRMSVPGTPEAKDALLSQAIPQTAAVDRKTATVEVRYDGKPVFNEVPGTAVSYALNTSQSVLKIKGVYYAVVDGVWYIAVTADGPWQVATQRPVEIDVLPPDSPVYNVRYVYIYDYTPDIVYVGYLPGYTYSYVYSGVVVYGSGFYYTPWYEHYYYPRPVTWGFGVHYNSYTGWGFSVGYSYGWMNWGYHPYPRYWGPRGYYPGFRMGAAYGAGYHRGYHQGIRDGSRERYRYQNHYNNIYRKGNRPGVKTRQVNNQTNININNN